MIKHHLTTNKSPVWTMKFTPLVLHADLFTLIHSPNLRLRGNNSVVNILYYTIIRSFKQCKPKGDVGKGHGKKSPHWFS